MPISSTDTRPPELTSVNSYSGVDAECPDHGVVTQVLQFNKDPARSYCGVCLEEFLLGERSSVNLATTVEG